MSNKPLPPHKYQRRNQGIAPLRPQDDGKTFIHRGKETEYYHKEWVKSASWKPHQCLGTDTETLDGYARYISMESSKVATWKKNRTPNTYSFTGKVKEVKSFVECIDAYVDEGRKYSKKRSKKVGKKTVEWMDRKWMTDQYFFYNLKFDSQAILKWLNKFEYTGKVNPDHKVILEDLLSDKEADGHEAWIDRLLTTGELIIPMGSFNKRKEIKKDCYEMETIYKWIEVIYLEGKWLTFKFKNMTRLVGGERFSISDLNFWDISQFYFKMPLMVASKKTLGYGKMETTFDGEKLDVSRLGEKDVLFVGEHFPYDTEDYKIADYWDYYEEDIKKYAIIDAELCGQLTRAKCQEYLDSGVRWRRTYSPANVAQTHLMDLGFNQTVNLMESDEDFMELMTMGQEAANGGNFDVSQIGLIPEECVQPDIVSAYPYTMYHLNSLMETKEEKKGKKTVYKDYVVGAICSGNDEATFLEWLEERETYEIGFVEVQIEFPKGLNWYPILEEVNGCLTAPRIVNRTITADELVEALKWKPISVKYGDWVFHSPPKKGKTYPFRKAITRLYKMKMDSPKDSAQYSVSKVSINSLFGKNFQVVDDQMGKMWNVAYAATITGATRARLAEINRLNGFKAISMATDGVIFKSKDLKVIPERPLPAPYNLGEWEEGERGEAIILGSGLYSFISEPVEDYESVWLQGVLPPREFKTTYRGSAKLFLNESQHNDWKHFAMEHSDKKELFTTKARPKSMKESRMKKDYELINIFIEQEYKLRPFGDSTKRKCPIRPTTFGDLLKNTYQLLPYESAAESLSYAIIMKDIAKGVEEDDI